MTPDEFVTQGREALLAGEAWLKDNGHHRDHRRVKLVHAVLEDIVGKYVETGTVSALSVGDKPEGP